MRGPRPALGERPTRRAACMPACRTGACAHAREGGASAALKSSALVWAQQPGARVNKGKRAAHFKRPRAWARCAAQPPQRAATTLQGDTCQPGACMGPTWLHGAQLVACMGPARTNTHALHSWPPPLPGAFSQHPCTMPSTNSVACAPAQHAPLQPGAFTAPMHGLPAPAALQARHAPRPVGDGMASQRKRPHTQLA